MVKEYPITINGQISKKYKAIADFERNKVEPYSIVTNNYKLVKHEDIIESIEDVLSSIDGLLNYEVEELDINNLMVMNGARMHRLYKCWDVETEVSKGDTINLAYLLSNSYDQSSSLRISSRSFRKRCLNDAWTGLDFVDIVGKHTKGLDIDKDKIKSRLESGIEKFQSLGDTWKQWKDIGVSKPTMVSAIQNIFEAEKHRTHSFKLLDMLKPAQCHLYALWNILTNTNSHSASFDTARSYDNKILSTIKQLNK